MASPVSRSRQGAPSDKKKPDDSKNKKKTEDAAGFIKKKLDDSGWFDTVSTGDLKQITAKLKELKPAQRNQVIGQLSDGELHKWADEIGSPWLGTGLDGGQKQELFNMLVPSLSESNLARVGQELTKADEDTATNEFILSVAMKASPNAKEAYISALSSLMYDDLDEQPEDAAFGKQQDFLYDWNPREKVAEIINGKPDHHQLIELKTLLEGLSPEDRAIVFTPKVDEFDHEPFSHEGINKLAERIASPDPAIGLSDTEKKSLFDVLSASMSGKQLADMQTALSGHDFMRAMDANIRLHQTTGHAQPMNSTDELGKALENYTNKQSLQRAAKDPHTHPVKRWAAKYIGPWLPPHKAKVPDAPVSPNGELFLQSLLKNNATDPGKKMDYITWISKTPVNPAQEKQVKAYSLDLAQTMVAERSAATAYNSFTVEEKAKYGNGMELVEDITGRLERIKNTNYHSTQFSTEENGVMDAIWLVDKHMKHLDHYSKELGAPRPLLAGILAAEVKFDTSWDVTDPINTDEIIGNGNGEGAFRAHSPAASDAVIYLSGNKVKKDLQDAHIDGLLNYLNTDSVKEYVKTAGSKGNDAPWFKDKSGPLGAKFAALITMSLAHQMWDAGKKDPATKTPADFGDFLENLSASQMASIYRGYRAGTDTDRTGGYNDYDAKLGVHKVKGGEDFARAVKDPRAVMGYQAYQSEPYFEYYLNSHRR